MLGQGWFFGPPISAADFMRSVKVESRAERLTAGGDRSGH